jgi:hypothetical protein
MEVELSIRLNLQKNKFYVRIKTEITIIIMNITILSLCKTVNKIRFEFGDTSGEGLTIEIQEIVEDIFSNLPEDLTNLTYTKDQLIEDIIGAVEIIGMEWVRSEGFRDEIIADLRKKQSERERTLGEVSASVNVRMKRIRETGSFLTDEGKLQI